jgi:hypothetical protein
MFLSLSIAVCAVVHQTITVQIKISMGLNYRRFMTQSAKMSERLCSAPKSYFGRSIVNIRAQSRTMRALLPVN